MIDGHDSSRPRKVSVLFLEFGISKALGVGVFGFDRCTPPRRLWPCRREAASKKSKEVCVRASGNKMNADAWCSFNDAGADLEQPDAQRRKFCEAWPARPGPHGILPHQPFVPVQAQIEAFNQNIAPDAPCSVEPAPAKAGVRSLAVKLCRQAWKPGRGTSSASHSHATGQIERCFATKANLMSLPSRSRLRPFLGCHAPP